jgi:uncharacterized membrane protein (UPF0127 family)
MAARLIAVNTTRGVALTACARVAENPWTRLVGLLRDAELAQGDGLWIVPCNSIHSFAMRFVFDAIFLDKHLRVVRLQPEMKPWRVSPLVFAAHSVLELPAGSIAHSGTALGDQFEMQRLKELAHGSDPA